MRYTRPSDWAYGAAVGSLSPALMLYWERVSPSFVGKGGFAPIMRLSGAIGITGCFWYAYSRSSSTSNISTSQKIEEGLLMVCDSALLRSP
jgi:hypothetical protein